MNPTAQITLDLSLQVPAVQEGRHGEMKINGAYLLLRWPYRNSSLHPDAEQVTSLTFLFIPKPLAPGALDHNTG